MKSIEKVVALALVLALLFSACTSDEAPDVAQETATAVETPVETPTEAPIDTPTEVPTPEPVELTDEQKVAAAIAAFDADPTPSDLIAWDHLEANVRESRVDVVVCGWTGESVFDSVNQTTYRVVPDDDGAEPRVIFESDSIVPGDCLNTELIESALQATRDFDTYWAGVLEDPTRFNVESAGEIMTEEHVQQSLGLVENWVDGALRWRGHGHDAGLPETSTEPMLWRRYDGTEEGISFLELLPCRLLAEDFGLYRSDVLVDSFKPPSATGSDVIDDFFLTRQGSRWLIAAVQSTGWADCSAFEPDWLAGINEWKPLPTSWAVIPGA